MKWTYAKRFNPCCPGSGSSTRRLVPAMFPDLQVSILVVLDRAPQQALRRVSPIVAEKFQSLLSWIGLLNREGLPCASRISGVSILVVLDRAPQLRRAVTHPTQARGFQSLLSWIGLLNFRLRQGRRRHVRGFNPCCPGSGSSTYVCLAAFDGVYQVSILVVLDRAPQLVVRTKQTHLAPLFQSLLSWIGLLNIDQTEDAVLCADVSILVVLDRAPQPCSGSQPPRIDPMVSILVVLDRAPQQLTSGTHSPHQPAVSILVVLDRAPQPAWPSWRNLLDKMFQSLLSWIGLLNIARLDKIPCRIMGFNPCCPGSGSSTRRRPPSPGWARRFNPCCPGSGSSTAAGRATWPMPIRSFNPCCPGSGSSTRTLWPAAWPIAWVSILVVLDRAPQRRTYPKSRYGE